MICSISAPLPLPTFSDPALVTHCHLTVLWLTFPILSSTRLLPSQIQYSQFIVIVSRAEDVLTPRLCLVEGFGEGLGR